MRSGFLISILCLAALLAGAAGSARAPASAQAAQQASPAAITLPIIVVPGPDLTIAAIELIQSVQTSAHNVPLVAGRQTVARVYARVARDTPMEGVVVSLAATRGGLPLPGSPLRLGPRQAPPAPARGDYGSSFNFTLPESWLAGEVSLVATVDPDGVLAEANEGNNSAAATATFNSIPPLNIRIVPVRYTDAATGKVYPAPERDPVSDWLLRSFPVSAVNVSFRPPLDFSGDLRRGPEWERLLNTLTVAKALDGAPDNLVYYGLVPLSDGATSWVGSGSTIAGIGWIRNRVATSLDFGPGKEDETGRVAAHEVGHNLGRYHAPCGTTADPRQPFPYGGASIGLDTYGLDVIRGRLWSPGAPDNTKDLMSYCEPVWLSDFTYRGLYDDQRQFGALASGPAGDGLLIRATLDESGAATLLPVYAVGGAARAGVGGSDYAVELRDAAGRTLATHPLRVLEAAPEPAAASAGGLIAVDAQAEPQAPPVRSIQAVVPPPGGEVASVRLLRGGVVVAERALSAAGAPGAKLAEPALARGPWGAELRWDAALGPALVRYASAGGDWVTLGVDVTGGALRVDLGALGAGGRFEIVPAGGGAPLSVVAAPVGDAHRYGAAGRGIRPSPAASVKRLLRRRRARPLPEEREAAHLRRRRSRI